jgi:uncharacterized protein YndB with AHSA1/START domain
MKLELSRVLPTPPAAVFDALTKPDVVARWWGPAGFSVPSLDFEPRPGAGYRIEMQPPEGGEAFALTGEFRVVEAPRRLALTFRWEPPSSDDVETLVELSLREADAGTELLLVQGEFKTDERVELHRGGWTDSLDKLESLLRG